jgi:hypothetical protein
MELMISVPNSVFFVQQRLVWHQRGGRTSTTSIML